MGGICWGLYLISHAVKAQRSGSASCRGQRVKGECLQVGTSKSRPPSWLTRYIRLAHKRADRCQGPLSPCTELIVVRYDSCSMGCQAPEQSAYVRCFATKHPSPAGTSLSLRRRPSYVSWPHQQPMVKARSYQAHVLKVCALIGGCNGVISTVSISAGVLINPSCVPQLYS